jgi:translation initiation factor IF-3
MALVLRQLIRRQWPTSAIARYSVKFQQSLWHQHSWTTALSSLSSRALVPLPVRTVFTETSSGKTSPTAPAPERPRRDEEITAPFIEVIEVNGEKRPGGPWPIRDVLGTLDREQYFLEEVNWSMEVPICRIYSKREQYERRRQLKERKRALASTRVSKQVIVSDNVQPHDMQHKLKKARQMLIKGYRVILSVETRPGTNKVSSPHKEQAKKRTAVLTEMMHKLRDVTSVAQNIVQDSYTTHVMLQGILDKSTSSKHNTDSETSE